MNIGFLYQEYAKRRIASECPGIPYTELKARGLREWHAINKNEKKWLEWKSLAEPYLNEPSSIKAVDKMEADGKVQRYSV